MTNANQIAMGANHMCEIRNDGEVWCYGSNSAGQLGDGTVSSSGEFVQADGLTDAVGVWATDDASFATTATGDLYAWGDNLDVCLGLKGESRYLKPTLVSGLSGVQKVVAGTCCSGTLALLSDGTIRVASDADGRFKDGVHFGLPELDYGQPPFEGVKDIASGNDSVYLINGDGTVWATGARTWTSATDARCSDDTFVETWQQVEGIADAEQLWGCYHGGICRTTKGDYYGWGSDYYGELGLGDTEIVRPPTALPHYDGVKQVATGFGHTLVLKDDGTVWTSGRNSESQLGDGTTTDRHSLLQVSIGEKVTEILAGDFVSMAVAASGRHVWGQHTYTGHMTENAWMQNGGRVF